MKTNDYIGRARVAKALAHPARMLIVDALRRKGMCVQELTELVGADQSTVSKHLAVLKGAGIVEDRREKSKVFYRLLCPCVVKFFECVEEVMASHVKRQRRECGR